MDDEDNGEFYEEEEPKFDNTVGDDDDQVYLESENEIYVEEP